MPPKRKRSDRPSRPSARYQQIIENTQLEERVQNSYSPTPPNSICTRTLPLHVQRDRDWPNFVLPSLTTMCLEVAARNFTTRVLPNQDTFAEAGTSAGAIAGPGRLSGATNGGAKSVGKRPAAATARNSPYRKPQKKPRGIGAKSRKGDSDDEKYDFKPSSDEEEENRNGSIGSGAASSLRQRTSTRGATTLSSSVDSLSNETTSAPLTDLKKLDQDDLHFLSERNRALLKILPSQVAARLLTLVATYHPHALTRHVLGTYFVSGRSIVSLNGSLPLFSAQPSAASLLLSSAPSGNVLRTLRLSGLTRLEDRALRGVFARCTALETVVLRGCVKVGASSIEALVKTCGSTLRTVNLDFTDVGAEGVKMLVQGAPRLEVMKLAGVGGLTDRAVRDLLSAATRFAMNQSPPFVPLCHVRTLKLRGTDISDVGVAELLKPCARTLERLDIGYTHVGETGGLDVLALALGLEMRVVYPTGPGGRYEDPDPNGGRHSISTGTRLKKLSLSGLTLHPGSLTSFLRAVLHEKPPCELQTLHLADMKERTTATTGTRNLSSTSRPSLSCLTLEAAVTGPLSALISARDYAQRQARLSKSDGPDAIPEKPQPPEPPRDPPLFTKLVLSGNPRLGHDHPLRPGALENPLGDLVRVAGKDCKTLVLENIPVHYGSLCFGLDRVRNLHLDDTGLDELALSRVAMSTNLETLSLARTLVTSESLDEVIDSNPYLTSLDLTSCRGISVRERRNYFEAYEARKRAVNANNS